MGTQNSFQLFLTSYRDKIDRRITNADSYPHDSSKNGPFPGWRIISEPPVLFSDKEAVAKAQFSGIGDDLILQ
ncbi:MAG: hypothetical protein B0D91_08030 [Oceanospirillales bacterium LUC14_002_19_P2]|nr:MAG: hypothetical protein B0D91_08030 [Oceanospirillales bacterium LUC14_002_19_P2]